MRYFVDTEFYCTTGTHASEISPISVGIVAEDGREFYAVNANWSRVPEEGSPFIKEIVIPALPVDDHACYVHGELSTIARDITAFIEDDHPEFWGDYAAFDYVVLTTIMGGMDQWPRSWPMYFCDMQQDAIPTIESATPHNALADARAMRDAWNWAFQDHPPLKDDTASLAAQVLAAGPPIDPTP